MSTQLHFFGILLILLLSVLNFKNFLRNVLAKLSSFHLLTNIFLNLYGTLFINNFFIFFFSLF